VSALTLFASLPGRRGVNTGRNGHWLRSGIDARLATHRAFDRVDEILVVPRPLITPPVDEESGGAVDSASNTAHEVASDPLSHVSGADDFQKSVGLDPQLRRISNQIECTEPILVLEQEIVHFPELALISGGFGSRSCE